MTKLSVNINKVATLRNARGGNVPDVVAFARRCELYGAQGITVHPRPDARHITYGDVIALKEVVTTEFNIEGYPSPEFLRLVLDVCPDQVTLVPDAPGALTSSAGWDTVAHFPLLQEMCRRLHEKPIRVSVFVAPDEKMVEAAAELGADRVELYTKPYADLYPSSPEKAVKPYVEASARAAAVGLGVNAGHDLSLKNLAYFHRMLPFLDEVSIGHALISDALDMGLHATIEAYLKCLKS